MPTYDYQCQACGHRFEKFQPITSKPSRKCPVCAKLKAKRLIGTGAGVIFKGSGFYQTDYRSSSYKEAAKKDSQDIKGAGSSKAEDKSADKSPAKPADKSSTKSDATSAAASKKK